MNHACERQNKRPRNGYASKNVDRREQINRSADQCFFVFPLNCGCHHIDNQQIEIFTVFDMTPRQPEQHLLPFIGALVSLTGFIVMPLVVSDYISSGIIISRGVCRSCIVQMAQEIIIWVVSTWGFK